MEKENGLPCYCTINDHMERMSYQIIPNDQNANKGNGHRGAGRGGGNGRASEREQGMREEVTTSHPLLSVFDQGHLSPGRGDKRCYVVSLPVSLSCSGKLFSSKGAEFGVANQTLCRWNTQKDGGSDSWLRDHRGRGQKSCRSQRT